MGGGLALLLEQDTQLKTADALCPVPLHPARLRERGYNQSYLLAQEVAKLTNFQLIDPLVRKRNTPSQTKQKDEKKRIENVHNAFAVKPKVQLAGLRLVLIDDVMTTGATLSAAAGELLQAGAKEVMGLVVSAGVAPVQSQKLKR